MVFADIYALNLDTVRWLEYGWWVGICVAILDIDDGYLCIVCLAYR